VKAAVHERITAATTAVNIVDGRLQMEECGYDRRQVILITIRIAYWEKTAARRTRVAANVMCHLAADFVN